MAMLAYRTANSRIDALPMALRDGLSSSEIESFSETNGAGGRAEGFGDFIDTSMCQAVNAPDRR